MRITGLKIQNFRSIKDVEVQLGESTVFLGPNNSGKTAILEALRITLSRRWGARGTGFTEHDVHLPDDSASPTSGAGTLIEVNASEAQSGEWPEDLLRALDGVVQTDPRSGLNSIILRVTYSWNPPESAFKTEWSFLNAARLPLAGSSARRTNIDPFWNYVPFFYLGALRDVEEEFSPTRSQFWGRLLKAMDIPEPLQARIQKVLDRLNRRLLAADARLAEVANTLSGATRVAVRNRPAGLELRLVPLKPFDLLSKAEIILRNEPGWPWIPLRRQGQGLQSLSVIFLFRAFVEQLLTLLYEAASEPVLALEEPETHLHPQAARALWTQVRELPGQKIITTHSPYFAQYVPIRDLRLVRLTGSGTTVTSVPREFSTSIPYVVELDRVVSAAAGLLGFNRGTDTLTVKGVLDEATCRDLMTGYGSHPDRAAITSRLRNLRDRSLLYISDDDLTKLDTCARRVRGEIFFASKWLLVEGQSEYLLVHAMARRQAYDFDDHGVSVIDTQNNGSPVLFAKLARALGIPWVAVFDGDPAGQGYVSSIKANGFEVSTVDRVCSCLSAGTLEDALIASGLDRELRGALMALGHTDAATIDVTELRRRLEGDKHAVAAELARQIDLDPSLASRFPTELLTAIETLRTLE